IASQLDDLWGAFSDLTSLPDDSSSRAGLVQAGASLGASFRDLAERLGSVGEQAQQSVTSAVEAVNRLLGSIADVNAQILKAKSLASPPADLLDQRDQLLEQLADQVDPQAIERPDGTVDVLVDGMLLVSGDRARSLETAPAAGGGV